MKSSETIILIIVGYDNTWEDHWQRRMATKLATAKLVTPADHLYGSLAQALRNIVEHVKASDKPCVFVAHSTGCTIVAHAIKPLRDAGVLDRVKGAFLVAPTSPQQLVKLPGLDPLIPKVPRDPLPFPSVVIASSNDEYVTMDEAADIANAWGAQFVEAGAQGHISTSSGHGPWPEGMMKFASWLSKL